LRRAHVGAMGLAPQGCRWALLVAGFAGACGGASARQPTSAVPGEP
jgi:hypothetical protein